MAIALKTYHGKSENSGLEVNSSKLSTISSVVLLAEAKESKSFFGNLFRIWHLIFHGKLRKSILIIYFILVNSLLCLLLWDGTVLYRQDMAAP